MAGGAGGASARRRAALTPCATAIVLALAAGCATNPVTGEREFSLMSEAQEIQIGQEQDAQIRKEMGVDADRELQQYVSDIGLRLARLSERPTLPWKFTINGLDAFVGTYRGVLQDLGAVAARAAHVAHGDNVFLVAGLAPQQIFQRQEPNFSRTIASFRPLTRAEAENIRPNRIDFYTARQGDTWQAIAERSGGVVKPSTLAIMNGHTVGEQPRPGERLKVVVAG
jgi:predicted Zn-dependent protease